MHLAYSNMTICTVLLLTENTAWRIWKWQRFWQRFIYDLTEVFLVQANTMQNAETHNLWNKIRSTPLFLGKKSPMSEISSSIHQTLILGWWMSALVHHCTNMQLLSSKTRFSTQILVPMPTSQTRDTFYATFLLYQRAVGLSKSSAELRLTLRHMEMLSTREQSTARSLSAPSGDYYTPEHRNQLSPSVWKFTWNIL
jgi:hypothetical protein